MYNKKEVIDMMVKLSNKDKKVDWELFIARHQEYSPAFAYLITASLTSKSWFSKTTGINFSFRFFKRVGDEYYWSVSDYKKLIRLLEKSGDSNPEFYIDIIKRSEGFCEELIEWALQMRRKDFSNTPNKKLLRLFEDYWEHLRKAAAFMLVKHNLNRVLERRIKAKINQLKELKSDSSEVFDNLLSPAKETLITKGRRELSDLAFQKKINQKAIDKWLQKYDWIEAFTWLGKPLQKTEVIKKLTQSKEEKNTKENTAKDNHIVTDDQSLLVEIEALQYLLYFHTFEIECLFAAHYWARNLLQEICSRLDITFQEYPYFTYPEIINALNGKPLDKTKIMKRKNNHYAIYLFHDEISIIEGDGLKRLMRSVDKMKEKTELRGRTAFLGKVKGYAIIVKSINDFSRLKKGDILIATMTTVDFTPYLKTVGAIVTNEGGITSHAAIMSREFQIPCIVGTHEATKIFKDGDLVEVDANTGIVRLLTN